MTITLAKGMNISPFEVMSQDVDEVIIFVNYFVSTAEKAEEKRIEKTVPRGGNDGFWDF